MTKKYTEEAIVKYFQAFNTANGRFPASCDLKKDPEAPDAKTLERRYGGIVAFKQKFGFGGDMRSSEEKTVKYKKTMAERTDAIHMFHRYLVDVYTMPMVHRNGCDFTIFLDPDGKKATLSAFYPSHPSNFDQCLKNAKQTTSDYYICLNDAVEPPVASGAISIQSFKNLVL